MQLNRAGILMSGMGNALRNPEVTKVGGRLLQVGNYGVVGGMAFSSIEALSHASSGNGINAGKSLADVMVTGTAGYAAATIAGPPGWAATGGALVYA